jgi:sugar lactone lactonase YvrE
VTGFDGARKLCWGVTSVALTSKLPSVQRSSISSVSLVVLGVACGGSEGNSPVPPTRTAPALAARSAPAVYALPGSGNGLLWDDRAHALYVTDESHGQLLRWTDAGELRAAGAFPASGQVGLGAIVRRADGSFVVPSFGFGKDGTIFTLTSAGASLALAGMDGARRRIALATDPGDQLYEGYFVVGPDKKHTGGVARVAVNGPTAVETPIATSAELRKVVGIAATATTLFACDQEASKIYSIALADGTTAAIATPPSCDLLLLLPHGDLVTGGPSGGVYRIAPTGAVTTIASGFAAVRGLAYDPSGHRLFFIEHVKGAGASDRLHVMAMPE